MTAGPVELSTVALVAALNPVAIAVAILMGAKADQASKLPIAAFAGAVAGVAVVWLLAALHIEWIAKPARAAGGIFVLGLVFDLAWAALGFRFFKKAG